MLLSQVNRCWHENLNPGAWDAERVGCRLDSAAVLFEEVEGLTQKTWFFRCADIAGFADAPAVAGHGLHGGLVAGRCHDAELPCAIEGVDR